MNQLNPYLHFGGNCRDALTFYRDCLGGELELLTVGQSPMADQMAPDAQNDVLHGCLTSGALTLVGFGHARYRRRVRRIRGRGARHRCFADAELRQRGFDQRFVRQTGRRRQGDLRARPAILGRDVRLADR